MWTLLLSTFDQFGRAHALKPFDVGGWTEEEARAQFVAFRFAETEGRPACVRCGSDAVQHYNCRPIYKCKRCDKQFSATSGTPWQRRKIAFRKLMYLISCIVHNVQAKSTLSISDDIGVQYKTALLWVHKLRAAIASQSEKAVLSGEVEIDGGYFGGFVRPKNQKKTQRDLRKIPWRDNDRAWSVVVARQRGGPIRTWVAKQEGDTRPFVRDAIERGSVVFSDEKADWKPLRGKFKLFQVNHKQAYASPEACTNQAETLWALMRVMGRVHRSLARNYLDLYAAEAAWTLTKGKKAKGQAFGELMTWMSSPGRSPLAGYFQGRKRHLSFCKRDGTMGEWKPQPRRGTAVYRERADGLAVEFKPRRSLRKTWHEGFTFINAGDFLNDTSVVPDHGGVYAIFLRDSEWLFSDSGFVASVDRPSWSHDGAIHAYTGESYGIRTRLIQHLQDDILVSNLRETLMALKSGLGVLDRGPPGGDERVLVETQLSAWLRDHAIIGFKPCNYVRDVERAILNSTASPLNLKRDNADSYVSLLQSERRRFRDDVTSAWTAPLPQTVIRPRR